MLIRKSETASSPSVSMTFFFFWSRSLDMLLAFRLYIYALPESSKVFHDNDTIRSVEDELKGGPV